MTPAEIQAMFDRPPTADEDKAAQIRDEIDALGEIDLRPLLVMQRLEIERLRNDIHSCHPGCTRAGCVNERLRTLADDRLQQMQADRQQALRWRDALHQISLCSLNSMSSKTECGRIAREALKETP